MTINLTARGAQRKKKAVNTMQIWAITIRYSEGVPAFSEATLRRAAFGLEVLAMQEHFFTYGNESHLTQGDVLGDAAGNEGFKPVRRERFQPGSDIARGVSGVKTMMVS